MKRELGIARCGLACCLCSENITCDGCAAGACHEDNRCENRACSIAKGLVGCFACEEPCEKGLLAKIKPRGFRLFIQRHGVEALLDCLEYYEANGVIYHRQGITGDYDNFTDVDTLLRFLEQGKQAGS